MKWSVGITTCQREHNTVSQLLHSLHDNGWNDITVYAEPNAEVSSYRVVRRDKNYGCWTNWICGLYDMYAMDIEADAYVMFEDDVLLCRNLRPYLERLVPALANFGALSLYTPSHQAKKTQGLFCIHDEGYRGGFIWGTQAIVFSSASLPRFLASKNVMEHRRTQTGATNKNRDSAIGMWAKQNGERVFYHTPSLVQHLRGPSSVGHDHHEASDFVGEDFDATSLLAAQMPIVVSPAEVYIL